MNAGDSETKQKILTSTAVKFLMFPIIVLLAPAIVFLGMYLVTALISAIFSIDVTSFGAQAIYEMAGGQPEGEWGTSFPSYGEVGEVPNLYLSTIFSGLTGREGSSYNMVIYTFGLWVSISLVYKMSLKMVFRLFDIAMGVLFIPIVAARSMMDYDPANKIFWDYIKSILSRTFIPIMIVTFLSLFFGIASILPNLETPAGGITDAFIRFLILAGASASFIKVEHWWGKVTGLGEDAMEMTVLDAVGGKQMMGAMKAGGKAMSNAIPKAKKEEWKGKAAEKMSSYNQNVMSVGNKLDRKLGTHLRSKKNVGNQSSGSGSSG